jgi:hypothetical protein
LHSICRIFGDGTCVTCRQVDRSEGAGAAAAEHKAQRPLQTDQASTRLIGPRKSILPTSTPLWRRMA